MNRLLEGYEQRIKEFLLKMVEKPILLNNSNKKYVTARQELYSLSANKILDKKGFVFKSYKSDKERINEIIKKKELLEKFLSKSNQRKQKQEYTKKLKEIQYIQPSMHFKKRSGLEVIYDIFKKKHHLNYDQKLLYNQLIKMGLIQSNYIKHQNEDENENENFNSANNIFGGNNFNYDILNNNSMSDEEKYKKILHDKILNERKNMLIKRKLLLNVGNRIKNMNKENLNKLEDKEFQRTYFKATENLTIFKSSNINHKLFKFWSYEDLNNQKNLNKSKKIFYKTISSNFPNLKKNSISLKKKLKKGISDIQLLDIESNDNNLNLQNNSIKTTNSNRFNLNKKSGFQYKKRKSAFNLIDDDKIINNLEIKKEIMTANPLLFKLQLKNELEKENNRDSFSYDKLNSLKKIAFENVEYHNSTSGSKEELDSFYDDYKIEENIIIDGKSFKKTDTDKIAENVLKKCNWNHKKINYQNLSGKGKLMFTNGLTVNEFGIKYGIIP